MRRSALKRRKPLDSRSRLKRGGQLKRSHKLQRSAPEPLDLRAIEFKRVIRGRCEVCGVTGLVRRHHVLTETRVRDAGGDPWDVGNAMWVGIEWLTCKCHTHHHDKFERIPLDKVPYRAIAFAVELLGHDAASDYFDKHYAPLSGKARVA